MLFNSLEFLFVFLPVTLAGYYLVGARGHHRIVMAWLVATSLFFYGWFNPVYLSLILVSILFNYSVGVQLCSREDDKLNRVVMVVGILANLGLLGYFKYANFFVDNINAFIGTSFVLEKILLPLAISFFTFQQVMYLVDARRGLTREYNFLHYCVFVTFSPQLIAGPIVHHREMMPQFASDSVYRFNGARFVAGLTLFVFGLFKKVVLADGIATYATPVYQLADSGAAVGFEQAWIAALGYTYQLYFDFSGYADMAIGLGLMFGIRLPDNFNSPYKSTNIAEFWRRWHITLGRFFREYLYIPLGGNRKGWVRTQLNIFLVMVVSGLWHGAGWNFLYWGALHGVAMVVHAVWSKTGVATRRFDGVTGKIYTLLCLLVTFVLVVFAWVYFRAETFAGADAIVRAMVEIPVSLEVEDFAVWFYLLFLGLFAFLMPNNNSVFFERSDWLAFNRQWYYLLITIAVLAGTLFVLLYMRNTVHEFLYFNF